MSCSNTGPEEMIASELKENGIKFKTINLTIPPHIMNQ